MKVMIVSFVFLGLMGCGVTPAPVPAPPTPEPDAAIIGGQPVRADSDLANHVVAIMGLTAGSEYLCSGVLIGQNLVLTAAHCAANMQSGEILFSTNLSTSDPAARRPVERSIVQPRYTATMKRLQEDNRKPGTKTRIKNWGDLALMWFSGPLPKGYSPVTRGDGNALSDGQVVVLAGYGVLDGQANTPAQGLNRVEVPIAKAKYSRTEFSINQANGKGVCHGDSGGPAFVQQGDQLLLVGITSRGSDPDCAKLSVFTRVSSFETWITEASGE